MPILRRHSLWTALNHTIYEHAIYLLKRIRWNFFTKRLLNFYYQYQIVWTNLYKTNWIAWPIKDKAYRRFLLQSVLQNDLKNIFSNICLKLCDLYKGRSVNLRSKFLKIFRSFFRRIEDKKHCFWNYLALNTNMDLYIIKINRFQMEVCKMDFWNFV